MPLRPADIQVLGAGPFDMVSTAFVSERGEITAIYESYSDEYQSSGGLRVVTSRDCGKTFSTPQPLALGGDTNYQITPSAVKLGRHQYLYFTSARSFEEEPVILRSRFREGQFGEPEGVGPISGANSVYSWPRFIEGPLGLGIAVAFRTSLERRSNLALSFDGIAFSGPLPVTAEPSAMPRTAFFRNGTAVFTYQTNSDDGWRFWSWWRLSTITAKGLSWTEPVLVTTNSENVHDTASFLRTDGDIDLYYIHSTLEITDTFRLYRRSLTRQGVLGPEELVTNVGSPNKPNLQRLPGGKVLLMYSDITRIDADGYPLEQIFKATVLAGDAPRPR